MNHRLAQPRLFPVRVSTHIVGPKEGQDFTILDHLQGPGHHKDQVSDALALPDDEVPRGTVSHLECGGQGAETTVTGQAEGGVAVEYSPWKNANS